MDMIKVILDTNFLIYCAENKIDYRHAIDDLIHEGYELVVPKQVAIELQSIERTATKLSDRSAAFLALRLLEHNNIKIIEVKGDYADEAILNLARIGNIVATLDLELRNKLKNSRKIVITGNKRVVFE